jgi:hypothetical protein
MTRPPWEVADIIRTAGSRFVERYRSSVPWAQLKVLRAVRTALGLIAISVSRLLNPGDPDKIPEVLRTELGPAYLQDHVRQIADETHRFWSRKIDRSGILFYAFTPIRSRRENGYHMNRYELLCPIATDDLTSTILKCLAEALKA